jgi:integrase
MKLTKTVVAGLSLPDGKRECIFWDDQLPGFGVRVLDGGYRAYVAQYRIGGRGGKQGRETLGSVSKFQTVEAARKAAREIMELASKGQNPRAVREAEARKIAQAITPLIDRFLSASKSGWSDKYYRDTERALKVYFKRLHTKALTEITRSDVSDELAVIQRERGDTSRNRARSALSAFYNWAIGEGLCEFNPVEKTNKAPETARDRELSKAELRRLWNALDADEFSQDERDVMRLMILTLQRESQIGDLRVAEIGPDRDLITWTRERFKNKSLAKHVIPLAPMAREIIDRRKLEGREFVFGRWDTGFSNFTHCKEKLDDAVKFNGPWVLHDLRRTGKTAMSEHLDVIGDVSESILNHGKRGMDAVYNSATYAKQKLDALTKWEQYVMAAVNSEEHRRGGCQKECVSRFL